MVTVKAVADIRDVSASEWDACAGNSNPSVSHAFLAALEESGSVSPHTGWVPQHLLLIAPNGSLIGAVPMYLKGHSYGEYIFDQAWAEAYERAGGQYYPKLLVAVPFTPVSGPRLLVRPDASTASLQRYLVDGCITLAHELGVSSLNFNFPDVDTWKLLGESGLLLRTGEDFLMVLSSRKRKAIRKERIASLCDGEIKIEIVSGDSINDTHWDAFYSFYIDTSQRKWGHPYLNRQFFRQIGNTMNDQIVLIMAVHNGEYVAGALNLLGREALYGRYWGCVKEYPFLHFEICYYQAIEYAITNQITKVEAGAQGPHKIQRGYSPVYTYSAHWIRDNSLREAVSNYLKSERKAVDVEINWLTGHEPFRKE